MNDALLFFSGQQLEAVLSYEKLVVALRQAFQQDFIVPTRHHHNYANPSLGSDSTLLLMPAWQIDGYLGVKMVTVTPQNSQRNLPAVQGIYILADTKTGTPLAYMDAKALTTLRTAATSALAATFLSKPNSQSLLMIGTGAMAPALIKAHATVRPIDKVFVWGRNFEKAMAIQQQFANAKYTVRAVETIEEIVAEVDIISCATFSKNPLLKGQWLTEGQHIDLVGSYQPDCREADDEVLQKASLFIDTEAAMKESGDLVIPLQTGVILSTDIKGDLTTLCQEKMSGRTNSQEVTCFKSVGYALEDLVAAKLAYEIILSKTIE
ncbi:MAG: ornithine cyclodeaminase family protein [Bacteroidota bacterium]